MCRRLIQTAALALVASFAWAEEPKTEPARAPSASPAFSRAQSSAWVTLMDRLRVQPRAGEISNGPVKAFVSDFFADEGANEVKVQALVTDYEKELAEMAAKWERELKQRRAEYEAKMLAELPEAKRQAAGKFLAMSRAKWEAAAEQDAKAREQFLEMARKTAAAQKKQQENPIETGFKIQAEYERTRQRDKDDVKALRDMLSPEAAARWDEYVRSRGYVPYKAPQK